MVLGGVVFRKWLGHQSGIVMNEIGALIREAPEGFLAFATM